MDIGKWIPEGKMKKVILIAGIVAAALLVLSVVMPEAKPEEAADLQKNTDEETVRYETELCERVQRIVSLIKGVGALDVTVTLENSIEYIYTKEEKSDSNVQNDGDEGVSKSASSEEKLILVEDANGRKTALLQKMILPAVRGVVVVCDGGDDPQVVNAVTEAVKTALGIRSTQVFVAKRAEKAA